MSRIGSDRSRTEWVKFYALVASTHQQKTLVSRNSRCQLFQGAILFQDFLDLGRQCMQTVNNLVSAFRERDAILRKLQGNHQKSDILRGISLCQPLASGDKV
jgi:hypothetical protein